jgi:very-short-patch-repair endonuclease
MRHASSTSRPSPHRERLLLERAAQMRFAPTSSEARLFEALRGGRLGVAFRRQAPLLGRFIVDLLAPEVRLVVEIDGGYHARRQAADARRDRALERAGYRVLRLDAELVTSDPAEAVARVRAEIARLVAQSGTR